jgi:hypothetical protein
MFPIFALAGDSSALDAAHAEKFVRLALAGLDREYPNISKHE